MTEQESLELLEQIQFYGITAEALNAYAHACEKRLKFLARHTKILSGKYDKTNRTSKIQNKLNNILKEAERLAEFGRIACRIRDQMIPKANEAKERLLLSI